jgi:secernin
VMRQSQGKITPQTMMAALRSHARSGGSLAEPLTGADVCAHAGFGPIRSSQSTGSMVSQLGPAGATHWLTGTSAPCTSVFKPLWMDAGLPEVGPAPKGTYDGATLYWRHEQLHRAILRDYPGRMALLQPERDALEARFIAQAPGPDAPAAQRRAFSAACFAEAAACEHTWLENVTAAPVRRRLPFYYRSAWKKFDREGEMG